MKRIVVLASGSGTNLQAIIDGCASRRDRRRRRRRGVEPVGGVCAHPCRRCRNRHRTRGPAGRRGQRRHYDTRLADTVASFEPDWVVLAGWMRILTREFLDRFAGRVVNLHPALPGRAARHAGDRAGVGTSRGRRADRIRRDGPPRPRRGCRRRTGSRVASRSGRRVWHTGDIRRRRPRHRARTPRRDAGGPVRIRQLLRSEVPT